MESAEAGLQFPVIGFTPDGEIWGFPGLAELTVCGPQTLRDNMQDGMELVDATCRRFAVLSVRRLGYAPRRSLIDFLSPRQHRIVQALEVMAPMTLPELKARVLTHVQSHSWDFSNGDEEELAKCEAAVRDSSSVAELHDALGLDWFAAY